MGLPEGGGPFSFVGWRMIYEKIRKSMLKSMRERPLDGGAYVDYIDLCRDVEGEDFSLAHKWNHEIRETLGKALAKAAEEQKWEAAEVLDGQMFRSLVFSAPHFQDDFMQAIEYGKPLAKKFYLPRRHYLLPVVQGYQDVLDGKLGLLTISLPKRTGKAVTLDTELITPHGKIRMRDVKPGTVLIGADGKPTLVREVFLQGKVPVYEVRFRDGARVKTCGEHLWEVKCHTGSGYSTRVLSTREMLSSGVKHWRHNVFAVRNTRPVGFEKRNLLLHPYVLGALLGDGSFRDKTICFTSFDPPVVARLKKYLPKGDRMYCQDPERGRYLITAKGGVKNGGHVASGVVQVLREYGLAEKMSYEKAIPEDYLYSDVKDRLELLRGLLDTDGYASAGHVEFSTTSEELAKQVQFLVWSLGGNCNIRCRMGHYTQAGERIETRTNYRVSVIFPEGVMPFHLPRRKNIYRPKRKELYHYIEEIVPCGEEEAQCICVDNKDSLFLLADHFIPTHNSQTEILFTLMLSGKEPDKATLMEGTGDDLVNSFYKGCLEYLDKSSGYHYYDIFPEARLVQTNADTKTLNLNNKSRFPTVMCRSIDARQVGLSEATNALILDDCVEGREEAKNRARLDFKWEVITGDVLGRAIEPVRVTPVIMTGTRYSIYDPIGRMQDEAVKQGWNWRAIEIPALDPITDESNFEHIRDGQKVFTTGYFRDQRELLSEEQFESEFQQQPFEAKGLLFPKGDLNYFFELPVDKAPDTILAVCDTAETGEDYCSMPVAAIYGDDVYIVDVVFNNAPPAVTKPECARKLIENKVSSCTFEANNAGGYFARDVAKLLDERKYICNIRTKRAISNKQTRIEFASDNIIKHFWFKHSSTYKRGSQYDVFMRQFTTHTRAGKGPHDAAADSLAMLENETRQIWTAKVEVFRRPI